MDFEKKVCFVTGGGSGIGRAVALELAKRGAYVAVGGCTLKKVEQVAAEMGERGLAIQMDVSSLSDWQEAVKQIHQRFGDISVVINNAGIADQTPLEYLTEEAFRASMDINMMSVFYSLKTAAEDMKKNHWGRIVNTSSIAGIRACGDNAAYAASKHAVDGLTKSAAFALAKYNVLVNCVHPGVVDTPMMDDVREKYPEAIAQICAMIPLKRMCKPEEVAKLIAFLASEDNTFVNGEGITIDGGQYA